MRMTASTSTTIFFAASYCTPTKLFLHRQNGNILEHFRCQRYARNPLCTQSSSWTRHRRRYLHVSSLKTPGTQQREEQPRSGETCNGDSPSSPHQPVLLEEICQFAAPVLGNGDGNGGGGDRVILDCTLGGGGHAMALLNRYGANIKRYIGVDKDLDAIELARGILRDYEHKMTYIHCDYRFISDVLLNDHGEIACDVREKGIDFILLDAGISTMQLNDSQRGFSFMKDGPLDMRMNGSAGAVDPKLTTCQAHEVLNTMSEAQLCDVLHTFGEERHARRIAAEIVKYRKEEGCIQRTGQLVEIVLRVKKFNRHVKIHPATQTFQALRIFVNQELNGLQHTIPLFPHLLKQYGRAAVISFHSLEDRIVKKQLQALASVTDLPGALQSLTTKPITASSAELQRNPRSRSAKLRVAQRLPPGQSGVKVSIDKYAHLKHK